MAPELDRFAVFDSYACRVGKGARAAVWRVQRQSRKHRWFGKLDVLHCFESIPIDNLLSRLSRRFDDEELLGLVTVIVEHGCGPSGRGLPIGNLTSQHLANFYLGAVDHHALDELRVGAWCRYMDDMILMGPSKTAVREKMDQLSEFVLAQLGLQIKQRAVRLAPVHTGIPLLGFRIWPQRLRLDGARRRRSLSRLSGLAGTEGLDGQQRAGSVLAWMDHADVRGLTRSACQPWRAQ
jgi:hypothetical protein